MEFVETFWYGEEIKMKKEEASLAFRTCGLLVPVLLTLFLEILKYIGYFKYSWFWVISPIWIWVLGVCQLFIAGFIYELRKKLGKNKNG